MKVVRRKSTGEILYRSEPEFEDGKGLINSILMCPNISEEDMEETDLNEAQIAEANKQRTYEQMVEARARAYSNEADILFFKSQRGEATYQDWVDKIEEIKERYPY